MKRLILVALLVSLCGGVAGCEHYHYHHPAEGPGSPPPPPSPGG